MLSDRRLTVRMIAEKLGLGKSSVRTILTEHLDMKKVCAKIVQKLLTPEQKLRRKECCADWKTSEQSDQFLEGVITGDKSWIYDYIIELKSQSVLCQMGSILKGTTLMYPKICKIKSL